MNLEPINTIVLESFIKKVKNADLQNIKEIKLDIKEAKTLTFTLALILNRLHGDLEKLIQKSNNDEVISINIDAGKNW